MAKTSYLIVEAPDSSAAVEFLSEGAVVSLIVGQGKLRIVVNVSDGEYASTWALHEFEVPLKK